MPSPVFGSETTALPFILGVPEANVVIRNVSQTFLSDSVEFTTVYRLAANRMFYFGLYGGPSGGPSGEIGQYADTNYVYEDVAQTFLSQSFSGYNVEIDIHQYIGFTDREFVDISQTVFSRFETSPPKSAVYDVELADCENAFSWNDHSSGDAAKEVFPANQSLGWTQQITDRSASEAVYDQFLATGQIADIGDTVLGSDFAQTFLRQHVSFRISNKKQTEKTYSPFIGESGDDSFPEVAATAPELGQGVLTLTHPRVAPTTTLVLKNPEFGNADVIRFTKVDRRTRGGDRKIFSDLGWGQTQSFELNITNICETTVTVDELIEFLNTSLGEEIGLLDWENRQWTGIIIVPETDITQRVEGYSVRIVFEGTLG